MDHSAVSFSNWWRTPSVSGLTGVLSVQIASVFVAIGRGQTTYSRVTILACMGESKGRNGSSSVLIQVSHPNFFNFLTHLQNLIVNNMADSQHLKHSAEIRRPKKKRNLQNDTRIKACIARYDAGAYDKLQFLRSISHSLGIHSDDENDDVNIDEQQQQQPSYVSHSNS